MRISIEQKIFCVKCMMEGKSFREGKNLYQRNFGSSPCHKSITNYEKIFSQKGNLDKKSGFVQNSQRRKKLI